ncbi:mechanosensitive ion channel family protein [Methylophilus flavus]|uniref:Mechanosensitive ion channel family protein n=1 Tax=Methylophilus flavus TaxID=640084 RepID=A0ABW3PEE4_9PROT
MTEWFTHFGIANPAEALILTKTLLRIAIIIGIAYFLNRVSKRALEALRDSLSNKTVNHVEEIKRINTVTMVLRYIITTVIIAITIVEVLHELGISIAPVLAAAGVVGLAIGFGAQSLVKDYFTGFFLLLENQIRKDDVIEVAGKSGLVEAITLRYIKMRDDDGNVHYVPNGQILTVTNRSRDFSYAVIEVTVAYEENIPEVIQIMQQVADNLSQDGVFKNKILGSAEISDIDKLTDSAVVIRCRFKVLPLEKAVIKREYYRRIKSALHQQQIELKPNS